MVASGRVIDLPVAGEGNESGLRPATLWPLITLPDWLDSLEKLRKTRPIPTFGIVKIPRMLRHLGRLIRLIMIIGTMVSCFFFPRMTKIKMIRSNSYASPPTTYHPDDCTFQLKMKMEKETRRKSGFGYQFMVIRLWCT